MKKSLQIILLVCLSFFAQKGISQKLIMEEIPEKILRPPVYGIRGIHYVHFFYETGLAAGKAGADTLHFSNAKSTAIRTGGRYILKLAKRLSFISELSYRFRSYNVKQYANRFPDTLQYRKEKLNFNQATASGAFRIIYGRKKTYFGSHVDVGFSYAWNFGTAHYTKKVVNAPGSESSRQIIRTRNKGLSYIQPYETDVYLAFGFEKIQFRLQYRLSKVFSDYKQKKLPEVPRFICSVNIAITEG